MRFSQLYNIKLMHVHACELSTYMHVRSIEIYRPTVRCMEEMEAVLSIPKMVPYRGFASDQVHTSIRSKLYTKMGKCLASTEGLEEAQRVSTWRPVSAS